MTQEQFLELLKKYRQGMCDPREKQIVEDWFDAISAPTKPFSDAQEEMQSRQTSWEHVDGVISREDQTDSGKGRALFAQWPIYAVAAGIALALMAVFYTYDEESAGPAFMQTFRNSDPGERHIINDGADPREFALKDGSTIRLMPGSRISLARQFRSGKREVYLDGEAFFEVAHDAERPFLVYTNALTTRVLGTSFLVKAYAGQEEIVVSVQTGKVSVYTNHSDDPGSAPQQEVILSPNQEVIYNTGDQLTLKKIVSAPQVILPQPTLKSNYTNAPVTEILLSLEDNYGIDIRYDSALLSNCTLTSDMSDEGFYEQIKIICNALGARYKVDETAIVIEATGCGTH